ncbi:MAG: type II toxin-antitoxin system RelE/ParE family toxin [Scytolyngbya sp. HA4215-MV1]|jgi:toxin ParE1/3/4|nr:type II toxin-antitoxin system RelE/ParE family toxin [Scytolyngbya sp. HA4215-MV1]
MNRCIIAPSASRDLNAIADYFLEHNIEAGEQLLQEFNQKCQKLLQFPNLGKRYAQLREDLRGLPLDGYIIFYRVQGNDVEILRVGSGRQDLAALFEDDE